MGDRGGGKTDMERIGLFQEMGYVTVGDKYATPKLSFNESAAKSKQMLPGGSKIRSALQHGYFADKYIRVMEGEAYSDPIKLRRITRLEAMKKNIGKPFLPSSGDKMMCGLGTHFGTIGGNVNHFSPVLRPGQGLKSPGKNILVNPGKKGTGYGYQNITIGKYPDYPNPGDKYADSGNIQKEIAAHKAACKGGAFRLNMHPQDFFDSNPYKSDKVFAAKEKGLNPDRDIKPFKPSSPGKRPGGCKLGTFDPYPSHSNDPYTGKVKMRPVHVVNKTGKVFTPNPGPKSRPQNSIVDQNIVRAINIKNYRDFAIRYQVT